MKKIISLVLACILLLGLWGCSSEPTLVSTTPISPDPVTDIPATDAPTTEVPTTEGSKTFQLGDSVELDDVVVSFLNVVESTGSEFNKPADGNVFVLCEFEITNNSAEELIVSSMISFEAYCDDYACEYSFGAILEAGSMNQLDGTVASGKKMKGAIGYELPQDWNELEVHYTPDVFDGNEIVFTATNS